MPPPAQRMVAFCLPGTVLLDLAAPAHLFGHCGGDRYTFELASVEAGPVPTSTGFAVVADRGLDALVDADTIVVPGLVDLSAPHPRVLAALAVAHDRGARVMSVCTGAFVLAHAGLLDGRRATTHWQSCDRLARRFPRVRVDPSVLYVDEGTVLTSAGVAAGLDLCLHVVRRDHGASVAAEVARRTVIAPHRAGGQAQYLDPPVAGPAASGLAPVLEWALTHLDEPIGPAELARVAGVARRTLFRRFRAEIGSPPGSWLLDQRVARARRLLEETALPIDVVATHSGFGSAAALRAQFAERVHTTPTAYRRSFRTAG